MSYIIELPDYKIIFDKKQMKGLWSDSQSFCILNFLNNLDMPMFTIQISQEDISILIENIFNMIEFNYMNGYFPLSSTSLDSNMNSYIFRFEYIDDDKIQINILEYNPQLDYLSERVKFHIGDYCHYDLTDFAIDLYRNFLENKEEYNYLSPDFLR